MQFSYNWEVVYRRRMASQPVMNKPNTIRPGEGKSVNTNKSGCC